MEADSKMLDQKKILVAIICAGVAILAALIWRCFYSIKNKGNEKALEVITKAQAVSAHTLWWWLICWGGLSTIIFKEGTVFTMNNIGTFILLLIGMQSLVELFAGFYYADLMKRNAEKTDAGQVKAEQA